MTVQEAPAATPKVRLGPNFWKLWWASLTSNLGDGAGMIAYLWVASAVTRNPVLIALIAVAGQLPWLVFTLPAGVLTDRLDRRKILVSMDFLRAALMVVLGIGVLMTASSLPTVAEVTGGIDLPTNVGLYLVLVTTALLRGMAEVLRDNTAQTFMPAIVDRANLEKANGNLWGAEMVANNFVGPP
ncbi:MAG TPA: MFS transporter, partial [Acidimicrobiia bacterium]|nr:MFS transporter [Acidimicrobiia bacterium]